MKTSTLALLTLCATGLLSCGSVLAYDDCDHTAPRSATVDAAGATAVRVTAAAGSLEVTGRRGSTVEATGTACAETPELLEEVRIQAEREGNEIHVTALMPEEGNVRAGLDLVLEVPADLPVFIRDGSGSTNVRGVAVLEIDDGSGSLDIAEVEGDVRVEDGSGSLDIGEVGGDLWIRDGSGSIEARAVRGSVTVEEDGSGSIDLADITGGVLVREDGSGSITVRDVGGDFVVESDGSGGISHRGVRGRVRVPADR